MKQPSGRKYGTRGVTEMISLKKTCRRLAVGSVVASLAAVASMFGVAHAENPAPPAPVPNPPEIGTPPHMPVPMPGGGG